MEPGREYVGQQGQILDLVHRLVPIRELQQVEVSVRNHHVLGLATDPAAHVDVAVGCSRTGRIDLEADSGLAFLAVAAAAAGDVERHRDQIAHVDELDIWAGLDDLAGDFVAEGQSHGSRGASPDHVLVASADVGGNYLENDAVTALAIPQRQLRKVDGLDFDFPWTDVVNASV